MSFTIAAFYHFFDFPDYAEKRKPLLSFLKENNIKGSILLAAEGFNGTLSGIPSDMVNTLNHIKALTGQHFDHKESTAQTQPFGKAKVRLKKEIVTLGIDVSPAKQTGKHVTPAEWNKIISDPKTVIIDARNHYEVHLGTFENAIDPHTKSFSELPAFVKKNVAPGSRIATFCTGGIRCEKFSAWLLEQGYDEVYQLGGGILKYLEEIPPETSKFRGECFVFDERVAVGANLAPSETTTMCKPCGHPLTPQDREHSLYSEGRQCPYCAKK